MDGVQVGGYFNHPLLFTVLSHKIEVAMKSTGDRKQAISVPPGGSGKLYGIVVVPESCPRGKSRFYVITFYYIPPPPRKLAITLKAERLKSSRRAFDNRDNRGRANYFLFSATVTNACQFEGGRCSKDQLCLPNGQNGRSCVCADDADGPCTDNL